MIDRLKEYIEKDEIYQAYKNGKLMNTSDFEKFCIHHCNDIEELLEKREEWIKLLNMFKKQQQEFINWLKAMSKMYEKEYKDVDIAEHYNCALQKYLEIIGENKNDQRRNKGG